MSGLNKGPSKVEVALKWDPSPLGAPDTDLDIVAGTYLSDAPHGAPDYLVHFGSRSPDGTINLNRDSRTGKGLGWDEVMVLELDRLAERYVRVVVGVAIQQTAERKTFGEVDSPEVQVREGYTVLQEDDFAAVGGATAATVAEFTRDATGAWEFRTMVRGYDADPATFAQEMGRAGA